jgi:hypothetical protein
VTKRIPGAKRGRPSKPKSPKVSRGKGRSPVPLHLHPRRHAIGAIDAFTMIFGSERKATQALSGAVIGEPIELDTNRPEMAQLSVPMSPQDFRKVTDRLRKQAQWYTSPADLLWRQAISQAIVFAITLGPASEQAVFARAEAVDEVAWARRVLLPMMTRQASGERECLVRIFADILSQPAA